MLASKIGDIATLILAIGWLVVAVAVFRLVWTKGLKSLTVELPGMKTKLDALDEKVDQINTAVNHQPEGSSTLVQRVQTIESDQRDHRRWEGQVMALIADQLGIRIPPPPPHLTKENTP
jgi:hypothetical protein